MSPRSMRVLLCALFGSAACQLSEAELDALEETPGALEVETYAITTTGGASAEDEEASAAVAARHEDVTWDMFHATPPAQADEAAREPEPGLGRRVARRALTVRAAPRRDAEPRGRVDAGAVFAVQARARGEGCGGEGWVRVDAGGYVCLRDAAQREPEVAPQSPADAGRVVPFLYGRPRADDPEQLRPLVPRFRSAVALARGEPPVDFLQPGRVYAFVESRRVEGAGLLLLDRAGRAVRAASVQLERPELFRGRDLEESPVAAGALAAWSVAAPAWVREAPGLGARTAGRAEHGAELDVDARPVQRDGARWYRIVAGGPEGWVDARDLRRWVPAPPPEEVEPDALWIDIDTGEQTLALLRGTSPVFVTMVAAADLPRGVFTVTEKHAAVDIAGAAVTEQVPWVQELGGRATLRASLGRDEAGEGAIGLSPRDAASVFARTGPALPRGWTSVRAHADDPGTLVRVRRAAGAS